MERLLKTPFCSALGTSVSVIQYAFIDLILMGEYVASMGIVLNSAKIYPFELVIMALIFVISVIPTIICTLNMSRKDGLSE